MGALTYWLVGSLKRFCVTAAQNTFLSLLTATGNAKFRNLAPLSEMLGHVAIDLDFIAPNLFCKGGGAFVLSSLKELSTIFSLLIKYCYCFGFCPHLKQHSGESVQ